VDEEDANIEPELKRKKVRTDEDDCCEGDQRDTPSGSGWTKDDISSWARECSPLPPPPTADALSTTA
jgi:hypothetical protein